MNAYELADDLEGWSDDWLSSGNKKNVFKKHAKMLRQQADRIAELSKNVDELEEELLKATHPNSEPVAWFDGEYYVCPELGYEYTITEQHPKDLGWIPLYTTPQIKELSDEEIQDLIINKVTDADMIRQALKKASEK
jgi:hypothetical protein